MEFRRRIQTRIGQRSMLKVSLRHRKPCRKTQCVWSEYSHALFDNGGVFWESHPPVVFTSREQHRTVFENQATWHSLFRHSTRMSGQQEMREAAAECGTLFTVYRFLINRRLCSKVAVKYSTVKQRNPQQSFIPSSGILCCIKQYAQYSLMARTIVGWFTWGYCLECL